MVGKSRLLLIALFAATTISIAALRLHGAGTSHSVPRVEVRVADIEDAVTAVGTLQPTQYVDVGAQVSGQIQSIAVAIGDQVKAGQLLAQIDPTLQRSTVEASQALLDSQRAVIQQLQAQLQLAKMEDDRQQQMLNEGATSVQQAQAATASKQITLAQLQSARAQMRQIESTLKGDRAKLGYTQIYAPMEGTVVSLPALVGQTLNAVQQTPVIMRIADLKHMTVSVKVSEADIPRLRVGMPVYFRTLGYPNDRWDAHLRQILPMPVNDSGTNGTAGGGGTSIGGNPVFYTAVFDVENADGRLLPQMTAEVFLVVQAALGVPALPLAALSPLPGGQYQVRVVNADSGDAQGSERSVEIGARGAVMVEIISGVEVGEQVLLPSPTADSIAAPGLW